ncbi:hypothetical protein A9Q84_00380 [Halobacteriovorax marinus]|uniref:Uncharacterized protein n=1 Tax=Halobacteriovorax marinus TaxID=97084 RepID=A0A1Y5FBR3_9BACT|nr:hypothetical protein A9Q84_00380 [Halobacteriovorax marinus]
MIFERRKVAKFQEQDCSLTLREAMEEFYSINSKLFSKPDPLTNWTELLVHHDVGHVFFGVNTSLLDETAGDCWTFFATDMTFKEYKDYANTPEGKKLIQDIGPKLLVKSLIFGIPLMCKVFLRSKKMSRKWQVRGYEEYLDMPLGEIRKLFKLEILKY